MTLRSTYCTGLLLATALSGGGYTAFAADPCPWQGEEYRDACTRWEAITQRIEAAAQQAAEAAQSLDALTVTAPPAAAPVEPGSAEARARAIVDLFLRYLTPPSPEVGGFDIDRRYLFTAEQDGLSTRFAKAAWVAGTFRADFGPLTFRIQPGDGGRARVDFRLGDVITLRDGEKTLARVLLGEQKTQGTWDEALQSFSQSDMQLANIELAVPGQPVVASLAKVAMNQVLERDAGDNWRTRQALDFQNLQVQIQGYAATLAGATGHTEMNGREYQKLLQISQDMNALFSQQNLEEAEAAKQLMGLIGGLYGTINRLDSQLTATDLLVGDPARPLAKIAKVTVGGHYAEAEGGSTVGYLLGFADLATQNPGLPAELIPTDARLEVGLFNITADTFNRLMEVVMASDKLPENERDAYLNQEMANLFLNSHLGAYLKDTYIATPATRLDVNFRATVDAQSAQGGIGEFKLRIEGLDKALATSQNMAGQESVAPLLGMLMAFSNRTQEGDKVIDAFDLKLGSDGKLWLNDKDVTAMFMPPDTNGVGQESAGEAAPAQEATPPSPAKP
jgi:hypothetical protein